MRVRYQRGPAMSGSGGTAAARGPGRSWRVRVSIQRAYGGDHGSVRHPLPPSLVVGMAAAVALACWSEDRHPLAPATIGAVLVGLATFLVARRHDPWPLRLMIAIVPIIALAHVRATVAWDSLTPRHTGEFQGWATLVGDPQPFPNATRSVLEIQGERFEYWARGRAKRLRVAEWVAGEHVLLSGMREALDPDRRLRVASQHVVGEVTVIWAAEVAEGGPLDRASNRVRDVLARGSQALPPGDDALFRGLVLGDDADQPPAMIDRFRASGLSHLTAVSGQNVAFMLAAAGAFLRRLRPAARWAITVTLIGWFVMLTRFEPSIMRAGAMAALSATAFVLGRERHPARLLCIAVIGLLLVDPLLARSVGFWLSTGATAGVTTVGPWLAGRLRVLGLLAVPVAVTLGAQVGVLVPALLVFGQVPLVSVPANVLAGPVAGGVMLYGLPAGLLAGGVPSVAPILMLPCRLGVRWVDLVATLGARLEPGGTANWIGWLVLLAMVGLLVTCGPGRNRR
jgi:competence protein ComEC